MKKFLVATAALLSANTANAAVMINFADVGGNVVATLTGSLDTTGLTSEGIFFLNVATQANAGYIGIGAEDVFVNAFSGFTGPSGFGPGSDFVDADASVGSNFAFNATGFGTPFIFVEQDYVSGSALAGTATFLGTSLATLGLATGSYVYNSSADTVTINVGPTGAVPEPATWAMMIAGVGMAGGALRRRKGNVSVRFA